MRLESVRLGRFMERSGVLPTTQFAYRKGPGTCVGSRGVSRFNEILITLIIIFIDKLIQIEVARINVWARHDLFSDFVTEG